MRWSIVRVIWVRELRDQLRDRRTLFMIAVLPILLYPLGGFGLIQLAVGGLETPTVGVAGVEYLPHAAEVGAEDFPPLLAEGPNGWHVVPAYLDKSEDQDPLRIRALPVDAPPRGPLDDRSIDLVVTVPPDFLPRLRDGESPALTLQGRAGDEQSRIAGGRFKSALVRWKRAVQQVRLARHGLPPDFDEPFRVSEPEAASPSVKQANTEMFKLLLRMVPFVLVLWSLAGALYPAVDLCAGEKERGTMETLLISPASREEIVCGKFLTIWVFSGATALLNLVSMGLTAWGLSSRLPNDAFRPDVLFWCVLLLLPLSAFFSAVCLAVGAYARSSKEGQYYLMPLFLLTLPLIFLTLAPGVVLNPLYSMVPVTGVALLLQRLILPDPEQGTPWLYFLPVLAPMVAYSWLALRWAVWQFQREEVLFREAERLDVALWLRRLFREKEALPTAGEAFFCFGLLVVLRALSLGFGGERNLLGMTAVTELAVAAAPPLFMALLLTTRPRLGLGLSLPPWWSWPAAALLAVLCVPPLAELTLLILGQFPALKQLLEEYHPLTGALQSGAALSSWSLLLLAALPALCEELAFRGFILTGLQRRFGEWTAVLLSSFLFALFQMNVFQFVPHFVLGLVLGLLVVRAGSVVPAMVFHLVYNVFLVAPLAFPQALGDTGALGQFAALRPALAVGCALLAAGLLAAILRAGRRAGKLHPAAAAETRGPEALAAPNGVAEAVKQARPS